MSYEHLALLPRYGDHGRGVGGGGAEPRKAAAMTDRPTSNEVTATLEFWRVAMSETEKWTEEDQAYLQGLAEGHAVNGPQLGDPLAKAARILAHMVGAEVPGEDDEG